MYYKLSSNNRSNMCGNPYKTQKMIFRYILIENRKYPNTKQRKELVLKGKKFY